MSKHRLQVMLEDDDLDLIREQARREGTTVSEWVRGVLRRAGSETASGNPARKLAAIRAATRHEFPAGDIDGLLAEVEQGYEA